MTKDEQVQLNALAVKLERYASRTEEALAHTSARLDRIDRTIETNSALLRDGWQKQQQTVAGLLATCAERQQRLVAAEAAIRDLVAEEHASFKFDPHIVTPVQGIPIPVSPVPGATFPFQGFGSTEAPPRKKTTMEVQTERADRAWRWARERASTIIAILTLLSILSVAAVWMVTTYQQIERLQETVSRATDSGAPPAH